MIETALVTGGTGTLGRAVVRRLCEHGRGVRVLSRRPRPRETRAEVGWVCGDLSTGAGLAEAVAEVGCVVHCATDRRTPRHDVEGIDRLVAAAKLAAVAPHIVYVSIVGIDRIPVGYYRAKLTVERRVQECGLPYTIQRATQFHDLVLSILRLLARSPVMLIPAGISCQPVDVDDVADRLVGFTVAAPAGRVPDMGGPQVRTLAELARAYLKAGGRRRALMPIALPGRTFARFRQGAHLTPEHADGLRSFDDFLVRRPELGTRS